MSMDIDSHVILALVQETKPPRARVRAELYKRCLSFEITSDHMIYRYR
jgi:hypothetical protein